MKKLLVVLMATITIGCLIVNASYAAQLTQTSSVDVTVGTVFSLEFYNDANVLYNTVIPFGTIDATNAYNYPTGRAEGDLKSDVGLVVKTNRNESWVLKLNVGAADTLLGSLGAYFGQPTNRNTNPGTPALGTRPFGDNWFNIPGTATTIYTADASEKVNTPFGTLATLGFKIDGTVLSPGAKSATITYTLISTP